MDTATGIRDPQFAPFWQGIRNVLVFVARDCCRDCVHHLASDPEDFAQKAFMEAFAFADRRLEGGVVTAETLGGLRSEILRYSAVALKRDFLDEIRKALHESGYAARTTQDSTQREGTCGLARCRVVTPEEEQLVKSLTRVMAHLSPSSKNRKIAEALRFVATHGGEQINSKDVTDLSGTSSRDLADFRKLIRKKLNINARAAFEEVDDDLQQRHQQ